MNKKIGAAGAIVDLIAVIGFAASMLLDFDSGSYFCSMFIAFGFVIMMCGFLYFAAPERRTAGYAAAAFSAVYAAIILVVYFTQLTTVRLFLPHSGSVASLLPRADRAKVILKKIMAHCNRSAPVCFPVLYAQSRASPALSFLYILSTNHGSVEALSAPSSVNHATPEFSASQTVSASWSSASKR